MSDVRAALLTAIDQTCDDFGAIADQVSGPAVTQGSPVADPHARDQFVRAFAALLREGVEGGTEQRELVMETAVPALVANGQSAMELLRAHVAFYTALSPHLLAAVPESLRAEAGTWLAGYAADYTREVVERAQAVERAAT